MDVLVASDHAGFILKGELIDYLTKSGRECLDLGTNSSDSVDYPDFARALSDTLINVPDAMGVLICGTGIGMSIAANRNTDIRCALAMTPEMATLARQHNNANVLALGARLIDTNLAQQIVEAFLNTAFEGGRHEARLQKIDLMQGMFPG